MDRDRLLSLLCCPACKGSLNPQRDALSCPRCRQHFPVVEGVPVMLEGADPAAFRAEAFHDHAPVSKHAYSRSSLELIDKHPHGLVLDLGAGAKETALPNVVQVDIFRFPRTDVVARAEALPFRSGTFDAVISQAVFEHLKYPETAAAEIRRICKPGAEVKIDTAFLQPLHGYPEHYFNATLAGLTHWFREFEILWSGIEPHQHPCYALDWFVRVYLDGLGPDQRQLLTRASFRDLLAALDHLAGRHTDSGPVAALAAALWYLPPPVQQSLAAGVSILARRPTEDLPASPGDPAVRLEARLEGLRQALAGAEARARHWQALWRIERAAAEVFHDHLQTRRHPWLLGPGRNLWRLGRRQAVALLACGLSALRGIGRRLHPPARATTPAGTPLPGRASPPPPRFCLVLPVPDGTDPRRLVRCLCSLQAQTYSQWECVLCFSRPGSGLAHELARGFTIRDRRFRIHYGDPDAWPARAVRGAFAGRIAAHAVLLPPLLEEFASLLVAHPDRQAVGCRSGSLDGDRITAAEGAAGLVLVRGEPAPGAAIPERARGDIPKVLYLLD